MTPALGNTGGASFIAVATVTKFLMNVARRMVYPFAPEFARGLNVDLSAITTGIALNQTTAVLGPIGAGFADKYGYKLLMLLAVAVLTVGCFAAGLLPFYPVLMIALGLAGFAKCLFDPSLQAFIGTSVSYQHRGKLIGIMEMAWAGATLVGIPITGIIIEKFSWQTPFWILGLFSLVCFFLILKLMPRTPASVREKRAGKKQKTSNWKALVKSPKVLGYLGFGFFMSMANDNLFVVYGAWLESSYDLSLAAIGFGTIFIGLSEVLAEGCTALFSDRIGLKRAVVCGTAMTTAAYFMLPLADRGLPFVLAAMFWLFFSFEFTIVTSMGLGTELMPQQRASTMAAFYAIAGIGRVVGAFSGGLVWTAFGIAGISLVSGVVCAGALFSILLGFYKSRPAIDIPRENL
jgi:predicted MFS family arabinose efflux permease